MRYTATILMLISWVCVMPVAGLNAEETDNIQIGESWEFNEDGNPEGWETYSSLSDPGVSGGTLRTIVTGPGACISGPDIDLVASEFGFIHLRMRIVEATAGTVVWEPDSGASGFAVFTVIGDGEFHEYEIPVHSNSKWAGNIKKLSRLCFNATKDAEIEIDYIRVVSLVRLELEHFKSLRTVLMKGQEFPLIAVVKNTGDKTSSFTATLSLPELFDLTLGDRIVEVSEITVGEEDTLRWMVKSDVTGRFSLGFKLFAEGAEPVEVALETVIVDKAWKLDKFFLSAWSPPSLTDEDYDYYAKANFEMILSTPPDESAVEMARKYDMRCLLRMGSILGENTFLRAPDNQPPQDLSQDDLSKLDSVIEKFKDNPTVCGYYITDEPNANAFPNLEKVVSYLREKDPDRLAYINLFPTYALYEQLGTSTYEEHVSRFMETVKPELLSYDHYHFFIDHDGPDYFHNLGIIRKWALKYDVPFCNIIQAVGWDEGDWRIPTEGEERWLVYSSLAYGAKAIIYFHWGGSWGVLASPKRDELYSAIQKLNREINLLGPILIELRSVAAYHTAEVPRGGVALPEDALVRSVSDNADLVVGLFKDDADQDYIFLMNKDYAQSVTASVALNKPISRLGAFNVDTGEWEEVSFESTGDGAVFECNLLPGGGILFTIGEPTEVGSSGGPALPKKSTLAQNYPNPFNATTTISYDLAEKCPVRLTIYDILGRKVTVLVNEMQRAGKYKFAWDADRFSSGPYIYNLDAGASAESRKMLLIK